MRSAIRHLTPAGRFIGGSSTRTCLVAASALASSRSAPSCPRAFHSTVAVKQDRLFAFPFGLPDHDALLSTYRSTDDPKSALSVLSDLESTLLTEQHALQLEEHLHDKLGAPNASAVDSAAYLHLAARTELRSARVDIIPASEMHVEALRKTWLMYAPDIGAVAKGQQDAEESQNVRFDVQWSTGRHSTRRELAPFTFHARLTATPFSLRPSTSSSESGETRYVCVDGPTHTLLDVSEVNQSRVDVEAFESVFNQLRGEHVNRNHFAWFVAFMASHPTDLAFDVISECLRRTS